MAPAESATEDYNIGFKLSLVTMVKMMLCYEVKMKMNTNFPNISALLHHRK
jgi:hypothetical protein